TKGFLLNQYFNCNIIEAEDFNEFVEIFSKKKEFDIIITDYSLNEGTFGSQVIDFIRDSQHNFTEIFFYSANDNVKDVKLFSNNRITFFQLTGGDYKELEDEILAVINQTIKKFQHIVAMRGMIMHETSSLDVLMNCLVKNYIEDSKNKANIDKILPHIFLEIQKNAKEKCDKAYSNKPSKILKDNVLFSASQKIFALGKILELVGETDFSEDYNKEIIWFRNQFAHAEIFVNEVGKEFFKVRIEGKEDELIFDEDLCKEIRKNIIKHKGNLEKLEVKIK
ncbi:hypothetical protein, partial [Flavobacterium succinicans]